MDEQAAAAVKPTLHVVLETLLAWPFLLFVLLAFVLYRSRGEIAQIIRTRQINVTLGGNTISIGEAVEDLDSDRKQALDDFRRHEQEIAELKREFAELRRGIPGMAEAEKAAEPPEAGEAPPEETPPKVGRNRRPGSFDRMLRSITDSKYRWRSLERLAIEARVSEDEALQTLRDHADQIYIGRSNAGKILARLKEPGDG